MLLAPWMLFAAFTANGFCQRLSVLKRARIAIPSRRTFRQKVAKRTANQGGSRTCSSLPGMPVYMLFGGKAEKIRAKRCLDRVFFGARMYPSEKRRPLEWRAIL